MTYTGSVHAERTAQCPFSVAQEYAEGYLRGAERGGDEATISAGPFGRRVLFRFALHSDITETGRPHDEIVLRWFARSALLPDFIGTLRMRPAGIATQLVLDGRYLPPFGGPGAVFDRLIGCRIAKATANGFLRRVAGTLDRRETTWREELAIERQQTRHA